MTKDQLTGLFQRHGTLSYDYRKASSSYKNDKAALKEMLREGVIAQSFKNGNKIVFIYIRKDESKG